MTSKHYAGTINILLCSWTIFFNSNYLFELQRNIWIYNWSSQLHTQLKQLWNYMSSNIWPFIYSFASFTFYGYITNSQSDQLPDGLIAQLVEHCIGNTEVMGLNPVQAWMFFLGSNFIKLQWSISYGMHMYSHCVLLHPGVHFKYITKDSTDKICCCSTCTMLLVSPSGKIVNYGCHGDCRRASSWLAKTACIFWSFG